MPAALRALAPADLARVVEIERNTFSDPWSPAAFRDALLQPHIRTLGAYDTAGWLAGYAIASVAADEGEILNMAVDPAARRQGLGARLLQGLLTDLEAVGVRSVYLEVRRSNEAAIRLYLRAGFEVLGVRAGYYRKPPEDALTMGFGVAPATQ